jgi:predicted nicotinamide N-methyase
MPYWAFAWPGGQVLARYVLDHPEVVRGKRVLDFGSGCAVEGIAALMAGAASVVCADIDATACEFALKNAALNDASVMVTESNLLRSAPGDFDVILAGDACYSPELAQQLLPWLGASRADVFIGDPLRVPGVLDDAEVLATYDASFDGDVRGLTLWPTHVLRLR